MVHSPNFISGKFQAMEVFEKVNYSLMQYFVVNSLFWATFEENVS
jgi:hypothetical protein